MIKKASTIILALAFAFTGFINLNSPKVVQAKPIENNPFAKLDKARNERISIVKGEAKDGDILKGGMSLKQRKLKEKKALNTPGKRYIVKFSNNASFEKIFEIVSKYEYKLLGKSDQRMFLVKLEDLQSFKEKTSGFIEHIEEDKKSELEAIPSDPSYKDQWGLLAINMPKAWDISKGSESVLVAVIDSGIYREHPDLVDVDIRNGANIVSGEPCYDDVQGHGTAVTGVIGAQTNNGIGIAGVNWDVSIVPFGVAHYSGEIYVSDEITAINLAADVGCKVINISLGADTYSKMENTAIQYALSKGSIVVASAGNEGNSVYNYPASYNGVISVGSINSRLSKSSFSTFNNKVDVVAPGEGILTTSDWQYTQYGKDYEYVNGTSFSSPYVAGVAAMAAAVAPSLTPTKFEKLIQSTSKDLGPIGYDNYYGYGVINAEKMLKSLAPRELTSIKITTPPARASYVEGEIFDKTGMVVKATYSDGTAATVTDYTVEPNRALAVTDTKVTVNYEGKTSGQQINVVGIAKRLPPAGNVPLDKVWSIKFNKNIDKNSINNSIYILDSNGNKVSLKYDIQGKQVNLIPIKNYLPGETYIIYTTQNMKSSDGSSLKGCTVKEFSTISEENK